MKASYSFVMLGKKVIRERNKCFVYKGEDHKTVKGGCLKQQEAGNAKIDDVGLIIKFQGLLPTIGSGSSTIIWERCTQKSFGGKRNKSSI